MLKLKCKPLLPILTLIVDPILFFLKTFLIFWVLHNILLEEVFHLGEAIITIQSISHDHAFWNLPLLYTNSNLNHRAKIMWENHRENDVMNSFISFGKHLMSIQSKHVPWTKERKNLGRVYFIVIKLNFCSSL